MAQLVSILSQVTVFGLAFFGVLMTVRWAEGALAVRRRLADQSAPASSSQQVIRDLQVRHPLLQWVDSAFLTNERDRTSLQTDLIQAGFTHPAAPMVYVAVRFCLALALPLLFIVSNVLLHRTSGGLIAVFLPILLSGIGLVGPRIVINLRAKRRRTRIEQQFPDALDLMVVCVEAGLGIDAAFLRVGEETADSHPQISQELHRLSEELAAGRTRADALRRLADRLNVDTIRAFVALLIQTEILGVSAAQSLRTYSAEMRETRYLRAEEKAMRIPVLMTLPLVACFMPVVVVALLLPTAIDIIRTVVPAMTAK